jgi:NADPH:quinone reductase-like Zn-dependent oxidoreductase
LYREGIDATGQILSGQPGSPPSPSDFFPTFLADRLFSLASPSALKNLTPMHLPTRTAAAIFGLTITITITMAAPSNERGGAVPPKSMKAVVAREYGGPSVLKLESIPVPTPKENEVLVRVLASGVNPADPLIVSGRYAQEFGTHLPLIPGYDMAGVVAKTGTGVKRLKIGDPVYAYLLWGGGWAEYCITNEGEAALKPKSLTYTEAAAVPLAALTAWQALVDAAKLGAGQTVLIHGGSGGVGSFAVQIAKAQGARVIATASTLNQDLLKELGADVAIDYTKARFEDVAKEVDVVLDTVGGETLTRSYGVVKKGGIITTIRGGLDQAELDKRGIRGTGIASHPNSDELDKITQLIEQKKIRPIVSQVLPLSEASKADEQAETHHTRGKIVLKTSAED